MTFDAEIFMQMLVIISPAGIANTAPVWGAKIPWLKEWDTPLDMGLSYGGKRLLGDHKTYRGIFMGVMSGCLMGGVLIYLIENHEYFAEITQIFGPDVNFILLGGLLGLFALLGDAVKSFFKRRINIRPGQPWPVLDQIDYILGAYVIIALNFDLTLIYYLTGFITYALIHPVVSYSAYLLKLKKDRF